MRARRAAAFTMALAAATTLFASAASAAPTSTGTAGAGGESQRLRVLTLNIFYGGDELDLATGDFCAEPDGCATTLRQVERLIKISRADIVGVQESERNTGRIAADLGWYGSDRAHVMSRFPIIDPPDSNGLYVFVQVAPGRVVAVANTHLPSDPYGPYLARDGGSRSEVLTLERETRLPAVKDLTTVLPSLARKGIPVLLTGDFNSPSHLDWTPAVDAARADVPFPVRWPASAALADAGLVDTYREAHPDPVAVPGFTWTPGGPETDPHEVYDRIDWVLRAGPSRTMDSQIVGEIGGPDVGVGISPYPTDHRGVVSTVDVVAAVPPVLVAPSTRAVTIGTKLPVTVRTKDNGSNHDGANRVALLDSRGRVVAKESIGHDRDATVNIKTAGLDRGRYDVVLQSGDTVLSRTQVWLYPKGEPTRVAVEESSYRVGQPIGVRWSNAPGMGLDWISVYRCGSDNCDADSDYLLYGYTKSDIEGRLILGPDSIEGSASWPLPAGRYVVRLLPDDGVRSVAESAVFEVKR